MIKSRINCPQRFAPLSDFEMKPVGGPRGQEIVWHEFPAADEMSARHNDLRCMRPRQMYGPCRTISYICQMYEIVLRWTETDV